MEIELSIVKKDSTGVYWVVFRIINNDCIVYNKAMYRLLLREIKNSGLKIIKSYEHKGYYKLTLTKDAIEKLCFFIKLYKKRMNALDTENVIYYEF